jgi:hypothetical protein
MGTVGTTQETFEQSLWDEIKRTYEGKVRNIIEKNHWEKI